MKKLNLALWILFSIVILVITVIHPRLNNIFLLLLCIMKCITSFLTKKTTTNSKLLKKNFLLMIVFAILWYMGKFFNILYPYHAVYEYENDITAYKKGTTGIYYQEFPERLPDHATNIKWICCPSLMQGSGYDMLFFHTDTVYLEELYKKYLHSAQPYTYSNYGWENAKTGQSISFPKLIDMTEKEKTETTVFITYDNQDMGHPHSSGLYINQTEGYICFFKQ